MGIQVSAAEAGMLVGRHERMVRWHIQRGDLPATKGARGQWQINTDDLARIPGWVVDRERLARMELRQTRGYPGLVARTEAMEAHLRALETQLRAIEQRLAALGRLRPPTEPTESNDTDDAADAPDEPDDPDDDPSASYRPPDAPGGPTGPLDGISGVSMPLSYRGPATVTLLDRGPDAPQTFATPADAARWLGRHGINPATPKTWPNWKHVELTPLGVLGFALRLQRTAVAARNHRVTWRLARCGDAACVCQELLGGD